jgi:hypothetical protein
LRSPPGRSRVGTRAQVPSDRSDGVHRRSAGRRATDPKTGRCVSRGSSLGARSVMRCTGGREGRLQGLHLPTSLVRPPPVSGARTFHLSHGLCSPSRLAPPAVQALAGAWTIPPPVGDPTAERATGVVARAGVHDPKVVVIVPARSLSGGRAAGPCVADRSRRRGFRGLHGVCDVKERSEDRLLF